MTDHIANFAVRHALRRLAEGLERRAVAEVAEARDAGRGDLERDGARARAVAARVVAEEVRGLLGRPAD